LSLTEFYWCIDCSDSLLLP